MVGPCKEYLAVSDTHNTTQKKSFLFFLSFIFSLSLSLSHNISLFVIVIVSLSLWLRHHQKPHKASFSCLPQYIRYDTGQFLCFFLCLFCQLSFFFFVFLSFFVFTCSLGFFYSSGVWRFSLNCESE